MNIKEKEMKEIIIFIANYPCLLNSDKSFENQLL